MKQSTFIIILFGCLMILASAGFLFGYFVGVKTTEVKPQSKPSQIDSLCYPITVDTTNPIKVRKI